MIIRRGTVTYRTIEMSRTCCGLMLLLTSMMGLASIISPKLCFFFKKKRFLSSHHRADLGHLWRLMRAAYAGVTDIAGSRLNRSTALNH